MPVDPLTWRPELHIHELRPANDSLVGTNRHCMHGWNTGSVVRNRAVISSCGKHVARVGPTVRASWWALMGTHRAREGYEYSYREDVSWSVWSVMWLLGAL
jgi:hypothetical protein